MTRPESSSLNDRATTSSRDRRRALTVSILLIVFVLFGIAAALGWRLVNGGLVGGVGASPTCEDRASARSSVCASCRRLQGLMTTSTLRFPGGTKTAGMF
jgi:hypothetical protein